MDSQDTFSQDIFEFDDPNKVAEPVMRLRSPWKFNADLVQDHDVVSEIADIADTTSIRLNLAATKLTRTRAGLLNPTGVSMTATQGESETAYAGRFLVAISTDGTNYVVEYQSSVNESAASYNVPAMHEEAFVVAVKCILYKADGFTERIATIVVPIEADISSAPTYWGALTTAPTTGVIAGDYYFDSNTIALGGGILRIYSNGMWPEYASSISNYAQSAAIALNDMMVWASASGSTIAAAKAVIEAIVADSAFIAKLATQTQVSSALCSDGVTPRMSIDWDAALMILRDYLQMSRMEVTDGYIKAFKGAGVQRRYAKFAQESLDFVDAPDTSPASSEILRGRIGRLGVGTSILLDGNFTVPTTSPWSGESIIDSAPSEYSSYVQLNTGELLVVYRRVSDGYLVSRTWNGSSWGSLSVINNSDSWYPRLIQTSAGELRIAYQRGTNGPLVERVWQYGAALGAETIINEANSDNAYPIYFQTNTGELRIAYIYFEWTTNSHPLVERIWNGSGWGAQTVINSGNSAFPTYVQLASGELRIAYRNSSGYLVERIWGGASWGSESVINAASSTFPTYVRLVTGELRIAYNRTSDKSLVERIWNGSYWGGESVIATGTSDNSYIQLNTGELRIAYVRTDYALVERRLARYYPLGAGITEIGENANGHYFKIRTGTGTGILVCWKSADSESTLTTSVSDSGGYYNTRQFTFPSSFSPGTYPLVKPASISISGVTNTSYWGVGNGLTNTQVSIAVTSSVSTNSAKPGYMAIGFYTE